MEQQKSFVWYFSHIPVAICALISFCFVNTIGRIQYRSKYLKGKWFQHWYSEGWRRAFRYFWSQAVFRSNGHIPWPVNSRIIVSDKNNISFDLDDINNFWGFGSYFQCFAGKILIGKGTYIAGNVGLITANHMPEDPDIHLPGKDIIIGEKCWIGMNSVILPGVTLGAHTVVGAGSVVTKSFSEGHCIVAGSPARIIRLLEIKSGEEKQNEA